MSHLYHACQILSHWRPAPNWAKGFIGYLSSGSGDHFWTVLPAFAVLGAVAIRSVS